MADIHNMPLKTPRGLHSSKKEGNTMSQHKTTSEHSLPARAIERYLSGENHTVDITPSEFNIPDQGRLV